ncbi:MAG TPA: hypothetical protein VFC92_06620 [Bacteroidales bacterium]|nr:hypothetical protein [Bacteroidales bacterium]
MAQFSKAERENKISYAKKLYVKGFDYHTIADMLGVSELTVSRWSQERDFETARRASLISLAEIRNAILNTYDQMSRGEKPTFSPDQIVKLTSSLEKLSPVNKSLAWVAEGFDQLADSYLAEVQRTKSEKGKQRLYEELKSVRRHMDKVMDKVNKEVLDG